MNIIIRHKIIYILPFISPQTRKLRCDGITDDEPQLQSLLNGINTLGGGELRRSIVTLRWEAL